MQNHSWSAAPVPSSATTSAAPSLYRPSPPNKLTSVEESRTLWIGNLQYWVDESYLAGCFSQIGDVQSIKIIRNKISGQPEGYGFIEFGSHASAEAILQSYNGLQMPGTDQTFRLNWASSGIGERRPDSGPDHSIFVGDLAPDVTNYMLQETFRVQYSSVRGAMVVTDPSTGRSKGYGFVKFRDESERNRAVTEMNGVYCSTRPMRISVARPKKTSSGVQQQYPVVKVIEGNSDENVTKASEKSTNVLEEAVKYSHFISLPLAIHPDLVVKLQNFQNAILGSASGQDSNLVSDSNDDTPDDSNNEVKPIAVTLELVNKKEDVRVKIDALNTNSNVGKLPSSVLSELGIDKSIFVKPETFHLTVLMLKLWNKDRIAAATEVLQKISSQVNDVLDNRPVFIALKGLECMRGSPAKACVVYASVEEIGGEGRLLRACQVITKAYVEAGLVLENDPRQTSKLHATLINVSHRKGRKTRGHDSFDARGIFLRYGSEKWGDYLIREAHLSQRFIFDEGGYYHCCASIPFPECIQVE